jgi:hypothetical protein
MRQARCVLSNSNFQPNLRSRVTSGHHGSRSLKSNSLRNSVRSDAMHIGTVVNTGQFAESQSNLWVIEEVTGRWQTADRVVNAARTASPMRCF